MADLMSKMRRAQASQQAGRLGDARALCEEILRNAPKCLEALLLRALVAVQQGDLYRSLADYDQVISIDPKLADAHSNRGAVLAAMSRWDEALANFDQAIAIRPDHAGAHFSRAILWLMQGDFARGWPEYEWRWKTPPGRALQERKNFSQPMWLGNDDIAGKTILLYSEMGLGDTLQFCRYVRSVRDLGANVLLQVQEPLVGLLARLEGASQVFAEAVQPPAFDLHCPLLSLPLALKTELATIPSGRYLSAPVSRTAAWRASFGRSVKPRVGLVWRGDPDNPDDLKRSLTLAQLLAHLPDGFEYFSLQKEIRDSERQAYAARCYQFDSGHDMDFVETAALCECLDLVISVDTSIAHMSAALGQRTWILLAYNSDCRWLLDRADSPWYSSVRLYRQTPGGDWRSLLDTVSADLAREFRGVLAPH